MNEKGMWCMWRGFLQDSPYFGFPFYGRFVWKVDKSKPVGQQLSVEWEASEL